MKMKMLAVVFLAVVPGLVSAADAYRWEDTEGNVYYSDQLPPADARNIKRTHTSGVKSEEQLPYRLQVVVDQFPVTLFVTDCGKPCDQARALLVERGVPHAMRDPSAPGGQEQLLALTGGELEVPVMQIGKTVLRGFESGQWNSALDAAGYPSYALIKVESKLPSKGKKRADANTDSDEAAEGDEFSESGIDTDLTDTEQTTTAEFAAGEDQAQVEIDDVPTDAAESGQNE